MTRDEFKAYVEGMKQLAATNPDRYLEHVAQVNAPEPACEECDDQGERLVPVDRDEFGNWSTEAVPCVCAAGRALRERLSRSSSAAQGRGVPGHRSKRADSGVSGSLVRGGDPDPSLKDAA